MSGTLSVTGLKEIDELLKGLPEQLKHRILQDAHADAAKPLINSAESKVPVKTGGLRRSIGAVKPSIKKAREIGLVKIGPRRGGRYEGYHGHLIEFGHRIVTKKGRIIGATRPNPFMEPAFNSTKDQVKSNIAESIAKILLRYMKRTIKKYA